MSKLLNYLLKSIAVAFLACFVVVNSQELFPSATIEAGDLGKIKGFKMFTNSIPARPYYEFAGIPYGESTVGANRFQPTKMRTGPLTGDPDGVFVANRWDKICPQESIFVIGNKSQLSPEANMIKALLDSPDSYLNRSDFGLPLDNDEPEAQATMGNEDCLVMYIKTPIVNVTEDTKLLPVIVYIHGGSFTSFWAALFNGGRLLNHDVLLVSINYRVGVLGWFNLGIDEAPGNAGLYDTKLALEWIQQYIHHFGGDKNHVTLTGQSAGAAVATHLMASPAEVVPDNLFHGVIGSSGSALQPWATAEDYLQHSLIIAENSGCYTPGDGDLDKLAILECMRTADPNTLVEALLKYVADDRKQAGIGFHAGNPSVQSLDLTIPRILTEMPYKVFLEGRQKKIPLMMGVTRHDGSFVLQKCYDYFILPNNLKDNSTYIREQLLADVLKGLSIGDSSYALVEAISDSFMGDAKYSGNFTEKTPGLIDIMSVFFMKAMSYRTTQLHSHVDPRSYYYSFDRVGLWSLHGITNIGGPIPSGSSHTDDQIYLFQWFPLLLPKDQAVAKRFTEYWVNFATYGNPNGPAGSAEVWPAYSDENPQYIMINVEDSIGNSYRSDWKNNSLELYNPPITDPPPTTVPTTFSTTVSTAPTTATTTSTTVSTEPTTTTTTLPTTSSSQEATTTVVPTTTSESSGIHMSYSLTQVLVVIVAAVALNF